MCPTFLDTVFVNSQLELDELDFSSYDKVHVFKETINDGMNAGYWIRMPKVNRGIGDSQPMTVSVSKAGMQYQIEATGYEARRIAHPHKPLTFLAVVVRAGTDLNPEYCDVLTTDSNVLADQLRGYDETFIFNQVFGSNGSAPHAIWRNSTVVTPEYQTFSLDKVFKKPYALRGRKVLIIVQLAERKYD